jgi:hypothetical protein
MKSGHIWAIFFIRVAKYTSFFTEIERFESTKRVFTQSVPSAVSRLTAIVCVSR